MNCFRNKRLIYLGILVFCISNLFSLTKDREIVLCFDFKDTSNREENYEFGYRLLNKDSIELNRGNIILNEENNMVLKIFPDVTMIHAFIKQESDADSYGTLTYVYSDTGILNITDKLVYKFYVVDSTKYILKKDKSNDYNISIINKMNSDYNFICIFDEKKIKLLEFVVPKELNSINLSELLRSDRYNPDKGFFTKSPLLISGDPYSLQKGTTYKIRVKSGKVNSYKSLRYYNNYDYLGTPLVY